MADSFLFSIAEIVLGRIALASSSSSAEQEIGLASAWGVKSELRKLESKLSAIKAVLLDAEEKRSKNLQLSDWLEKLKDVVYDVEDVLEDFQYEALRRQGIINGGKVCNFFAIVFRIQMGHRIKEVTDRLDKISAEKSNFHLMERLDDVPVKKIKIDHSFAHPSDIIGRDHDKDMVIEHLIHNGDHSDNNVSVISIVGIGGLGKTTLAKLVYNDVRVKHHFQIKAWVCVSDKFDVLELMKEIIKAVSHKDVGDYTVQDAQTCLRDTLRGDKFLLILDDVWNEDREKWVDLRNLLLDGGAIGSKILVTTRSPLVASIMDSVSVHELKGLPDEDCLSLFVKWAFREGEEKHPPKLMAIGNEIVKKCGGIPLAVKTLGGLLYLNSDEHDWLFIKDNDIWKLEQKENGILPALLLSYEKLPSVLKHCFAICSLYPKDYHFVEDELIDLWMALGLIKPTNEAQEFEEIGKRYVNELMSRSFFQDVDFYLGGTFFKMHDLFHDLALHVAQSECMTVNSHTSNNISKKVRHVSICDRDLSCEEVPKDLLDLNSLRTIFFPIVGMGHTTTSFVETCASRFRYLRVLDMSYSTFQVLPSSIGDINHLRLIDLSRNTRIKKLPKSLGKLLSLQSLNLLGCVELEELPKDVMEKLINLRVLVITTKQVSLEIGCLPSLRDLRIFRCKNLKSLGEQGMERLTALRNLHIAECGSVESLPRGLKYYLATLEELFIRDCPLFTLMEDSEEDTLQGLLPRLSLQILNLEDLPLLVALPQWLQGAADTLHYMRLGSCWRLTTMPAWLQTFNSLQTLEIERCDGLIALPEGMDRLVALRNLTIEGCPELIRRCQPEIGEDWDKIAHVPKITLAYEEIQNI